MFKSITTDVCCVRTIHGVDIWSLHKGHVDGCLTHSVVQDARENNFPNVGLFYHAEANSLNFNLAFLSINIIQLKYKHH